MVSRCTKYLWNQCSTCSDLCYQYHKHSQNGKIYILNQQTFNKYNKTLFKSIYLLYFQIHNDFKHVVLGVLRHPSASSHTASNLRFQSLIGLTPERKVYYFFCIHKLEKNVRCLKQSYFN